MAKGTRYTPEFKAKAVRLLTESRGSYSSETKAIEQVAKDLGAPETKQSAEDAMAELKSLRAEVARLRRANEILTTASVFPRPGSTRHGVDGRLHRRIQGPFQGRADLQGAGRLLDCGLVTPRGCRMFESGLVSRMAARHEAPARDILEVYADSFMAVCGCRKTHARSLARGRDPAGIGRGRVTNVMRESFVFN